MTRAVLVTGAARRLGAAIARRLAGEGWRVVVHYGRSGEAAYALAAEIGAAGVVQGDLADPGGADALFARASEAAGGAVDALVNSASAFSFDAAPRIDIALAERLYRVNYLSPVLLASALARQEQLSEGAIVNLLDQKVANLNPDFFSYTAAKLALAGATTMLAQALAPRIRVNAVAPGLTLPSADQSADEFAAVGSENLLRRPIGAEEVAGGVAYLLGARSVTGQTVFVDGGQRFLARDGDVMFRDRARPA